MITKTLAFHTSTNYQILAPPPFSADVHEDVLASLARIANQTYANDFDLHVDLSRTLKRLNDGHCVYINACYDGGLIFASSVFSIIQQPLALYVTYIPLPLVFLTKADGTQAVHIAPEAFQVASAEFYDQMSYWQSVLPGHIQGQLSSVRTSVASGSCLSKRSQLSGAEVRFINGDDPLVAVDKNAGIAGGYQALGTRQNGFAYHSLSAFSCTFLHDL